jgi:hypothetical protein
MSYRTTVMTFAMLVMSAMPARSAHVLEVGGDSCGKWIEARRARGTVTEVMHTSWVYGYLSAAAALLEGDARGAVFLGKNNQTLIEKADILNPKYIDANAINAWMDNYCRAHPSEIIADALRVLLAGLKEKTGYLEEAVCETSDLGEEGRAGCRKAFEATNRSAVSTLGDFGPASVTVHDGKFHRPRPKPAGSAQAPQTLPAVSR